MSTCRDAIDVLRAYLEGELPADEKRSPEEHLGGCTPCVDFLKTYKETPGLCKKALHGKLPADGVASLSAVLTKHTQA